MNARSDSAVLLAAQAYATKGWPVFPCSPVDKKPLVPTGYKAASTDPAVIRGWWKKWPRALIGLPTGSRVGFFVIDLDLGDPVLISAADYLARFREHVGGTIPHTAVSETGSGGLHLCFAWPADGKIGIGADLAPALHIPPAEGTKSRDGKKPKGAQVDVRGDGGYIIAPPSVRADGGAYAWCPGPEDGFADAPDAILRIARKEEQKAARAASQPARAAAPRPAAPSGADAARRYAISALARETEDLAATVTGGRNDRLNIAAMKLGQLVGSGALTEGEVRSALEGAAERCGLVSDDGWPSVRATFAKGFAKGLSEPRDLSEIGARARLERPSARKVEMELPAAGASEAGGSGEEQAGDATEGEEAPTGEAPREPNVNGFSMRRMNSEFAFILVGSKAVILRERDDGPIEQRVRILTIGAFREWSANRFTEFWDEKGKIKRIRFADAWMTSQFRREYDGLEFHPDPNGAAGADGYFNLWRGFAVVPKPKANGYAVLRDHLLNNICEGDKSLYAWVFGFFAHMVQRPRERNGTALIFRGQQGTGKTVVGEAIGSLFPSHFFLVDNPRYLVGQFNAHMAQCLLLQADEAVWAGDKHAEGRLKGLITSAEQMIESKGIDPIRLKNYVRIIMTSNERWVVPAGKEERRFCVLDVNPRCMQNIEYFSEMEAELSNGGREALLHDLLTFDLSQINLRQIPRTEALLEQKVHSFDSMDSWWMERLEAGAILHVADEWPATVPTNALYLDYVAAAERVGQRRKIDPNVFGMRLFELMPGLERKRAPRGYMPAFDPEPGEARGPKRPWLYALPALDVCREAFDARIGQPHSWPQEED